MVVTRCGLVEPRSEERRAKPDTRPPAPGLTTPAAPPETPATPRHDRASELDSWDCLDELVAEEDYSQEWGEAAPR